ncbi:hypothetical protein EVAR_24251_1 [Eumeta japonica]|uniref:Uncharacterized protein n=1 Tax=Eumeta variegata TaxID=151549 RepID=A0A4C1VEY7_EUMVA|nr:hypothetical protein EVAR_24251_1 [Eumeta japonica]
MVFLNVAGGTTTADLIESQRCQTVTVVDLRGEELSSSNSSQNLYVLKVRCPILRILRSSDKLPNDNHFRQSYLIIRSVPLTWYYYLTRKRDTTLAVSRAQSNAARYLVSTHNALRQALNRYLDFDSNTEEFVNAERTAV